MTAPVVPLKTLGHVDPAWHLALGDTLEHIPDVMQPWAATFTYSQMRRDPQLAAILAAYTLPVRRATWAVDPAGCRPDVAQMVADDLGLPVLGDDTPGAARTRGVSWQEHLRAALLHLTFGHSAFELLAEIDKDGRARLAGLFERTASTITSIHLDDQGRMLGISQDSRAHDDPPQIPVDRLVWYVREREGTNWYGTSLLRPAFAAYTLKREALRTLATSSRRFGMGVPTIEWATGVTPTPQQMQAAQQAASAARVGDQSGLALPPGATLVLKGLTGSAPDTLAFCRYLDQQMSRMTLTGFLDLPETTHGSRALGTAFIDLFTLSLSALSDFVGDVATRQVAARIVEWNFGTDEPVPTVRATDVGTKHEFTADAINQLVTAGALQPDPALDAYLRRAFQLPERDVSAPWTPPAPKGVGGRPALPAAPVADTQPVAASRPRARSKRTQATGQGALFAAADGEPVRDLTVDEQASGADFEGIQADHDGAVAALVALLPGLLAPIAASLVAAVLAELAAGTLSGALEPAEHTVEALAKAIDNAGVKLAAKSARRARGEVKSIGLPVPAVQVDGSQIAEQAQVTARLIVQGIAAAASRVALLHNGPGVDPAQVVAAVQTELDALVADGRNWITDSASSALWAAQHAGRMAVFEALNAKHGDKVTMVASEVNDDPNQCEPCAKVDGTRYPSFTDALADYPTGRFRGCLGSSRCRGQLVAVPAR